MLLIRDSNPGPVFSIPGFGIGEFLIPGSRRDYGIPAVGYEKPLLLSIWAYIAKFGCFFSRRHRPVHLG